MPPLERAGFVFAPIGSRYSRSRALSFQQCAPYHHVDCSRFIFPREKHYAAGGAGALAAGDDAGDVDALLVACVVHIIGGFQLHAAEFGDGFVIGTLY